MSMIKPMHDRIVIRRIEEERTIGGIVIPDSAAEKPSRGEVLRVGPGKTLENGHIQALSLKEGDVVLFGKYAGTEVKVDGETYVIMREDDVLAVLVNKKGE